MGRGVPPDRWAPPCGTIVIQADQGYACTQCRYIASLGVCNMGTPRHGAEGPASTKAPRGGSGRTGHTPRRRMKTVFGWLTSSVLRLARRVGAIAGGWPQESALRKGGELRNRVDPRAHEPFTHHARTAPSPPTPVSALRSASKRKEITMNRPSPGIVVGFAAQP